MGWATDFAPNVHTATIQRRQDRGTVADGAQDHGDTLTARVMVDVMRPDWKSRNGFPIESQMAQLSADDDAPILAQVVKGDRIDVPSLNLSLLAMDRATVAAVVDFPLAELMVWDDAQGGNRL